MFERARQVVTGHLNNVFHDAEIYYENIPAYDLDGVDQYVTFSMRFGESAIVAFGNSRRYRTEGLVIHQIFTKKHAGTKPAYMLADSLASVWRGASVDGVQFYSSPVLNYVGIEDQWLQHNLSAPFYVDIIA